MHWLLSVPDTFSLREVVRRSGWLLYPPFRSQAVGDRLLRVEHLAEHTTVDLAIYQAPAGLVIQTEAHLSGAEVEEASHKAWHMLRLDENVQPFLRSARPHEALRSVRRMGARLLRGASLYEHVIVSALVAWDSQGMPDFAHVAGLVDRLGVPLERNPTLHSFPTPDRLLANAGDLDDVLGSDAAAHIDRIAHAFQGHHPRIRLLVRQPVTGAELAERLAAEFGLDAPAVGLLMLYLGRYDYIPTDEVALRRAAAYWPGATPLAQELVTFFEQWHPWGGLAYWLWDWSQPQAAGEPAKSASSIPAGTPTS